MVAANSVRVLLLASACATSVAHAGWQQQALNKQYNLQKHTPLVQSNIVGTHNSYSSNAYNMKLYENQNISITDQLNEGARFLELDLWRNTELEYVSTILCHNGGRCGIWTSDYMYTDTALREIADWAKANRDQVVVIKLEDQMDDASYHYFAEAIQRTLGDIVYRPPRTSNNQGRIMFPTDLTAADMLAQGKQVIFQGYAGASDNSIGRGWVFGTTNSERDGGSTIDNRSALLNCGDHANSRYALFYDSAAEDDFSSDKYVPTDMIQPLMRCGGSVFGFDWLTANDPRTKAAIWSWAENEPSNGVNEDCAVSTAGRFNDVACGLNHAYLCSDGQNWKVTTASGEWSQGQTICVAEFGATYAFDVPRTAKQNAAAEQAKATAGKSAYWLNYSDTTHEGYWLTGADKKHLADQGSSVDALKVASWNKYQWVYSDAGTGGDNNISIWRVTDLPYGWYSLGDTVGLATSGSYAYTYSRKPGSSLIAYDDGSGALAKPLGYDWRWNDWKTGGDTDVTLWSPIAPAGYTCLGDIAIAIDSRTQPSKDLVRCVRDDLLLEGSSLWEWSDAGSGGEYDATIYLTTTKVSADVNLGLSPNNFDVNSTNSRKVLNRNKVDWIGGPKAVIAVQPVAVKSPDYRELKVMGVCMDTAVNGNNVFVHSCWNPATWQKWVYEEATGFIRNKSNPHMCLDATNGNSAGTSVKMWQCEDHINLKWDFVGATIRPRKNHNLALDVKWGAPNDGQDLWLWNVDAGVAQTFGWGN
jgi:hypothetical protein